MTDTVELRKGKAFLEGEWVEVNFIKLPRDGLPVINLCYRTWGELLDHKHLVGEEDIEFVDEQKPSN